jgi:hypothetical protein
LARILPCWHLALVNLAAAIKALGKLALYVTPLRRRLLDAS